MSAPLLRTSRIPGGLTLKRLAYLDLADADSYVRDSLFLLIVDLTFFFGTYQPSSFLVLMHGYADFTRDLHRGSDPPRVEVDLVYNCDTTMYDRAVRWELLMDPTLQGKLAVLRAVFRETIVLPLLAQRFTKLKAIINAEQIDSTTNKMMDGEYRIIYIFVTELISLATLKSHHHQ